MAIVQPLRPGETVQVGGQVAGFCRLHADGPEMPVCGNCRGHASSSLCGAVRFALDSRAAFASNSRLSTCFAWPSPSDPR